MNNIYNFQLRMYLRQISCSL